MGRRRGWRGERRWRRVLATAAVAVTVSAGLAGCEPRPHVIVYGDSLVWESTTEIRQWAAARGWDATVRTRFGGAPCSLYDTMRSDRGLRPRAVILSFSGNSSYLAPCVGADVVASYRAQVHEVKRIWTGRGAHVAFASVPRLPQETSERVQEVFRGVAPHLGMPFHDGGKYVSPGRVWTYALPCMPGERCVGRQLNPAVPAGQNIVRANDRVHLCPGPGHGFDPCPVYNSGSWRYARALTEVLDTVR